MESFIPDGKIHRFKGVSRKSNSAWYVSHGSWGAWGDWATNETHTFTDGKKVDRETQRIILSSISHSKQKLQRIVARECWDFWKDLPEPIDHPYLAMKKVPNYGLRQSDHALYAPIHDTEGQIWSLQKILSNGSKYYQKNARKNGCFSFIGNIENEESVFLCEGYATAASIFMATGRTTIMAFDAPNLLPVTSALLKKFPLLRITIAADNDIWKPHIGNVGLREAERCREYHDVSIKIPIFDCRHNDFEPKDWNDMHILEGLKVTKEMLL